LLLAVGLLLLLVNLLSSEGLEDLSLAAVLLGAALLGAASVTAAVAGVFFTVAHGEGSLGQVPLSRPGIPLQPVPNSPARARIHAARFNFMLSPVCFVG
jgi:hypothetical protein